MKRWGFFKLAVVLVVVAVAIRLMPEVVALTSATVDFTGSYSVGGGGTPLIYCSLNKSSVPLVVGGKNGTSAGNATLTCYNNSAAAVTLNLSITGSALSGTGNKRPAWSWTGTTMSIAGGGSQSRTINFSVNNGDDKNITYTFTFNVSGTTTPSVLDYTHNGYSISIPVT